MRVAILLLGILSISNIFAQDSHAVAAVPNDAQINCLAQTIYYEAGNQPEIGKLAVAHVVFNRINHRGWNNDPEAVCKVIKERNGPRNRYCQWGWVCNQKLQKAPKNNEQWIACYELAVKLMYQIENRPDPTKGAEFFHGVNEHPYWPTYVRTTKIGGHIFYRMKVH